MRCFGFTNFKNLQLCGNTSRWGFCRFHSRQPLVWCSSVFGFVAGTASILGLFGPLRGPVAEYKALPAAETNSDQSVPRPTSPRSPRESATPTVSPTLVPNPLSAQAINSSSRKRQLAQNAETALDHINRARALLGREQLDAALVECNKAIALEPKNQIAIDLKNSIENFKKLEQKE